MSKPTARQCLSRLFGALLALCLAPALVEAQRAPVLDHFKCYRTTGEPPNVEVLLRDQFDDPAAAPDKTFVRFPVKFCNPVQKTTADGTVTEITDINAHLEMFITAPGRLEPPRKLVVRNQFGIQQLTTYGPELLAVPSAKNTQPPPENLDHFKCYRASGRSKKVELKLTDQFQEGAPATLLRPIEFCNPVEKTHGTVTTKIKHPRAHLLCYQITTTTFQGDALVRNQFSGGPLPLATADMLCVPSQKLRFSVVTP
jgi:hypothetical protein